MEGLDKMSTLELLKNQNAGAASPAPSVKQATADALAEPKETGMADAAQDETQAAPTVAQPQSADDIKKMKLKDVNALFAGLGAEAIAASGLAVAWDTMSMSAKKDELIDMFFPASDTPHQDAEVSDAVDALAQTETAKPASKAKAKKVEAQALDNEDVIATTAHEIENVKNAQAALEQVHVLESQGGFLNFKLGGYLSLIQTKAWFGDHPTFKAFIENETELDYRKAMYLISIYNGLIDADIPWSQVSGLGWTKLKELVGVLNKDNVAEWVEKAQHSTVLQLQADIQAYKKQANAGEQAPDQPAADSIVSTLTFKVHDDQKETINAAVEKAMKATGTEVKSVAMEHIALDYLAGNVKKADTAKLTPPADEFELTPELAAKNVEARAFFKALIDMAGPDKRIEVAEAVLNAYDEVWPDVRLDVEFPNPDGSYDSDNEGTAAHDGEA